MEYLDVLDKNGNLTSQKKLRSEVHRDGDWHRTTHLWIINSEHQLLIQRRSPNKETCPNMWDISAAGHVQAGDSPAEAAKRELVEELGIDSKDTEPEFLFSIVHQTVHHGGNFINNSINDVSLICLDFDPASATLQEEGVSEVKWIDYKELETDIKNNPEQYAQHTEEYEKLFKLLHERYDK